MASSMPSIKTIRRIFSRHLPQDQASEITGDKVADDSNNGLPLEMLIHILTFVPLADLIRCRQVCRRFKHVIDDTPEMQYQIELSVAGLEDNKGCTGQATSVRLDALKSLLYCQKEFRGTWRQESIGSDWVTDAFLVRYYENVWVRCFNEGAAAELHQWNSIQCVSWEPLKSGRVVSDTWSLSFLVAFEGFGADPARDRLFLLNTRSVTGERTYRIRTVSLSDGVLIDEKLFTIEAEHPKRWTVYMLPVLDDLLGAFTFENYTEGRYASTWRLMLMDITSGKTTNISRTDLSHTARLSFNILTANCVLLHFFDNGVTTTEVYKVTDLSDKLGIHHVATVQYPKFLDTYIRSVGGTAHQSELLGRICGGSMSRLVPPRPHSVPTTATVIYMLRCIGHPCPTNPRLVQIIAVTAFTSLVESFDSQTDQSQPPKIIPWKNWGPTNTRCFLDETSHLFGTYGYKILLPDFRLLDFNPLALARDLHLAASSAQSTAESRRGSLRGKGLLGSFRRRKNPKPTPESAQLQEGHDVELPGTTARIVRQPTVIKAGTMFEEDIVTSLPYRETKVPWSGPPVVSYSYGGEAWVTCQKTLFEDGTISNDYYTFQPDAA